VELLVARKIDTLAEKKAKLSELNKKSTDAVDLVSKTINHLQSVNNDITLTVKEIEDHQSELEETKVGLRDTMSRNSKVITNFKTLLAVD
jgi:peptidoglycan hydrolase CwlO-like protein